MHLVVRVISISAVFVLDECEAAMHVSQWIIAKTGQRYAYSRLDVDRGAGMSQRTSRPYLLWLCQFASLSMALQGLDSV